MSREHIASAWPESSMNVVVGLLPWLGLPSGTGVVLTQQYVAPEMLCYCARISLWNFKFF